MPQDGNTLQQLLAAATEKLAEDKQGREKPKGKLVIQKR
jgi:hypothetical protein